MTDFYNVSSKQTTFVIPDFSHSYNLRPGADTTADNKILAHNASLTMPTNSTHRVVFDFVSKGFFLQNPDAHVAVVARCDTAALAAGDPRGAGIVIGNLSGYPGGRGNPKFPSSQIEAFWAGVHPPPDTRNDLLPESSWFGTFHDHTKYRIVVDSQYKADKKSRTAYEIHKVENDGSTTELFKSGFFFDGNIWYDATKNGAVIGYVLGNAAAAAWSIDFTNVKSIIAELPPEYVSGTTDVDGGKITLTFDSPLKATNTPANLFSVRTEGTELPVASVKISGATVELDVNTTVTVGGKVITAAPIRKGKIVSVSYNAQTGDALQSGAGVLVATFPARQIINISENEEDSWGEETFEAVSVRSVTDGNTSTVTINYPVELDASKVPPVSAYEVLIDGAGHGVASVRVEGKSVKLTLANAVNEGKSVRVNYAVPSSGAVQDKKGNQAAGGSLPISTFIFFKSNPKNLAARYVNWAAFEMKYFHQRDQVVNEFDDFVLTSSPGAMTLNASETGGYNVLPPGAIPSDVSKFRLMFSFFTDDYFAKNVHCGFNVSFRSGDDELGAMLSVTGEGGPIIYDQQLSSSAASVKFTVGMNPAYRPAKDDISHFWLRHNGTGDDKSIFAGDTLFTVIVDCDVTSRDEKTGAIKTFDEALQLFAWKNGAPAELYSSKRHYEVPATYKVDFSRTGIKFAKDIRVTNSVFSAPEDPDWKIEFTHIKAAWAGRGIKRPNDPGPKDNRKVIVTCSHPDIIKLEGVADFIKSPFRDDLYSYNKRPAWSTQLPVPYSSNGAQVRMLKGEQFKYDKGRVAAGGEPRVSGLRYNDFEAYRGALNLTDIRIRIDVADGENKDCDAHIVTAAHEHGSIDVLYNDFENTQIRKVGVPSKREYYTKRNDGLERFGTTREKSLTYSLGFASTGDPNIATVGMINCDQDTKVVSDSIVIFHDIGDVFYQETEALTSNIVTNKQILENAWVEIVIPIDLDWGKEPNPGGDGGGETAPGIPQLPSLFAGIEQPKTPEATVDFVVQVVRNTTAVPVNTKQFEAIVAAAAFMGPDAYKKSRFSIMLNAGNPLAAADALGDLQTYIDLGLDPDEKKALAAAKTLHAALAPFKDIFLQGGYLDEFGEYQDTPQTIDAMASQPGYVERPQFLPNDPVGFQDPHKQYPKPNHKDEPDTSRIQRQERARASQQFKKEQARHKEVIRSNQAGAWQQPASGYNARYPYNHATTTESGHVFELDDTPGSERINMYHRTGTFFEIDNTGTRVRRTVGDDYTILERDGKVHIVGNADVTIGGARRVRVENTFDLEVHGATTINVFNDVNLRVAGDLKAKVSGGLHASVVGDTNVAAMGAMQLRSNGNMFLTTGGKLIVNAKGSIEMNTSGEFVSKSAGATKLGAGGQVAIDGSSTYIQSGGASSGAASVPEFKIEKDLKFSPKKVALPPLYPHSRDQEAAAVFETPDEGSETDVDAWKKKRLDEGTTTPIESSREPVKPKGDDVEAAASKGPAGTPVNVDIPENREFRGDDKISKYFTLADLTHKYSRKLTDRFGNTAQDKFKALSYLATNALDVIKAKYPSMVITSGLRDFIPSGGAKNSAHLTGHAVDIQFPGLDRKGHQQRAVEISKLIEYDQMLLEYAANGNGWIHIAMKPNPRGMAFTMYNHRKVAGSDGKFVVVA